jgi:uncharacterized membrane protein YgcG
MAFKNYNNNTNTPTTTTYSPISFSNGDSKVEGTRLSISYFNKLMKISIAKKTSGGGNNDYATFDNDNAVTVYVSYSKAKILLDLLRTRFTYDDVHNVCVELKNGLLKVSDGVEFGSTMPCISISSADANGNVTETIYQCKDNFYTGAYNYNNGKYSSESFDLFELDTFEMVLEEYYRASSYAIAATVMEANMYKREGQYNLIRAIADKVGASTQGGGNSGGYNSKTFLAGNGNSGNGGGMNGVAAEYEASSFDDIASSMNLPE